MEGVRIVHNEDGAPVVIYSSNAELDVLEIENIDGYPVQHDIEEGESSEIQVIGTLPSGTIDVDIDSAGTTTKFVGPYTYADINVPAGSATTPDTTITANPTIEIDTETGEIYAYVSQDETITPDVVEGWVDSGTEGTITVEGEATEQLTLCDSDDLSVTILDQKNQFFKLKGTSITAAAGYYPSDTTKTKAIAEADLSRTGTLSIDSSGNTVMHVTPKEHGMVYTCEEYDISGQQLLIQNATTITPTKSEQTAVAANKYTLGAVKVGPIPDDYIIPEGSQTITSNDTYDVTELAEVVVNVSGGGSPTLQSKTVTPTESVQTVTADDGYDGLDEVEVEAISSTYVGSGITQRTSSDLTALGATVSAPAGYYSSSASKSVASGSAATPATTITANPSISVSSGGLITATASASQSITPTVSEGWVSSGTAGTVTVSGSNTSQLSTQAAATITPSTSQQTAVASGKYTTGNVVVDPIPSQYIIPSGTDEITVSSSGTVTEDVTSYASAEITVPSGSATTPTTSITANPSISVSSGGLITASVSASQSVTPTVSSGWVSSGTSGTVSVSGSNTSQLSTQAAATITPTTSQQTAVAAGKYTTGAVVVDPIPSQYIVPTGTIQIPSNGTGIDVSQYATADVSVSGGNIGEILDGSVTSVSESTITNLRHSVLRACSQLVSVNFPNVTTLGSYDFYQCTSLTSVNLPKAKNEASNSLYGCTSLQSITLPALTRCGTNFMQGCSSLTTVDLGVCNRFGGNTFNGCLNLNVLILRLDTVVALSSTNVFTNTPFASGGTGGTIYIPKSLYDHLGDNSSSDYKYATNWSTIQGYGTITWAKIEGSQYENYYADGTPIS